MPAIAWLFSAAFKAALVLAASCLGAAILRRGTAAQRHQIWALGALGALALPLLCWALPSLPPSLSLPTPALGAGRALQATVVLVTGGPAPDGALPWPVWLAGIWAAGALLVSLRILGAHLAARRLSRLAQPLGRAEGVPMARSQAIASPMTIGVLRPRVLLPAASDGWSPERLRAVLIHEIGHVRRRDNLVQLGAQLGCVLYWWNPLAWLAASRLRVEREHACDDLVLRAGIRSSSYAADLLELARAPSAGAARAGAACMVDRSRTEARLRRILDPATPRRPLGARFRLAARGATLALAVTLAGASAPLALPLPLGAAPAAAAPARALWLGAPSLGGDAPPPALARNYIDLSLVAGEMERHADDLNRCYERRRLAHPGLSGGVVVQGTIAPDGRISERNVVHDSLGDAEVLSCVDDLLQESRFPAPPEGPLNVTFPFFFGRRPEEGC